LGKGDDNSRRSRSLANIRKWWSLLVVFVVIILLFSFTLQSPVPSLDPHYRPSPESHLLTDALYHSLPPGDLNLHVLQSKVSEVVDVTRTNTCTPVSKLGFMKTHKTASSTVQNILMRYTANSDWNFVMYSSGSHLGPPTNQYSLTKPFRARWLGQLPWTDMVNSQGYNVFALHTKWDQGEVTKILGDSEEPRKGKYFTILRDPVDQFESLYNYVHFDKTFHMDLEQFVHTFVAGRKTIQRVNGYLGRSQQLWDLGLRLEDLTNHLKVKEKVRQVKEDFDLVMIAEDFPSSLVLLSEVLCWPLQNMTSLKLNARKKSAKENLSQEARRILKDWLWADYMLYDFFKQELEMKKEKFGLTELSHKVDDLALLNAKLKEDCVIEVVKNTNALSSDFKPWSKDVLGFKINEHNEQCANYALAENHFIGHIRKTQTERARTWDSNQ